MNEITIYSISTFASECAKESKQFSSYLNEDKIQYDNAINLLDNRIINEKKDIDKLNSDINICNNIIDKNQREIDIGEKNISYYKEIIKNCEEEISSLEAEKSRKLSVVDENGNQPDVGPINERIAALERDISNFKDSIYKTELAIERFRNNVSSLKSIIQNIENCIKEKEQFIYDIFNTMNNLNKEYTNYEHNMINLQNSLDSLATKISHFAYIITNYGDCISNIRYGFTSIGYSEFKNIYVTSSDLYDEARMFAKFYTNAEVKAEVIRKELSRYTNNLVDKLSKSSDDIFGKVDEKITYINKCYLDFSKTLRTCAEIISEYERNF